jgi:hypothetical protein
MFDWADNKLKLDRAIQKTGIEDEQALYKEYIALGGRVVPGHELEASKEVKAKDVEKVIEQVTAPVVKPAKPGRKPAKPRVPVL